jgi:hypothetical protein
LSSVEAYGQPAAAPGVPLSPAEPVQAVFSRHQFAKTLLSRLGFLSESETPLVMLQVEVQATLSIRVFAAS